MFNAIWDFDPGANKVMQRFAAAVARTAIAAWFGAATIFTSVLMGLRYSPLFTDEIKLNHPRVLFPVYYSTAAIFIGLAAIGCCIGWKRLRPTMSAPRMFVTFFALLAAVQLADYVLVYLPLVEMMQADVLPQPAFKNQHRLSIVLNVACLALTSVAAILANFPAAATATPANERP